MKNESAGPIIYTPERLHRIIDVVFAVSMVLFIISGMMSFNDLTWTEYETDPDAFMLGQFTEIVTAFLVFLFIGLYWYTHANQSKYIVKVDNTYTWINLFYLFFIALAPFPNALSMQFGDDFYVQLFFNIDMFFIGLFGFLAWVYATRKRRLVHPDITNEQISATNKEMIVEPCVAVIAMVVTFIDRSWWEASMLLLPIGIILLNISGKKKKTATSK
jgi:uncharacterized membrane protein